MFSGRFTDESLRALESCEFSMKAKQCRDPFLVLNKRSNHLFEMIHADLWGPYGEENICNIKYVVIIVKYHNRVMWTYLISSKD